MELLLILQSLKQLLNIMFVQIFLWMNDNYENKLQ